MAILGEAWGGQGKDIKPHRNWGARSRGKETASVWLAQQGSHVAYSIGNGRILIDGNEVCHRQIGIGVSVEVGGDDLGGIVVEPGNRRTGIESAVAFAQQDVHRAIGLV